MVKGIGVLSETYQKFNNPEYQRQPINVANFLQPTHISKHNLDGLKPSVKTHTINPRSAHIDLHNYSTLANPMRQEEDYLQAVRNYQSELLGVSMTPIRHGKDLDILSPFLSRRARRFIKIISEGDSRRDLLDNVFPQNKFFKMKDEDLLKKLNNIYRDDKEQLGLIEEGYDKAGRDLAF